MNDKDQQAKVFRNSTRFDTDSFLNNLRDGLKEETKVHAGPAEPQAMGRVRDLHNKLKNVVGNLNEKVSQVLQKQESEFLTAYRAHMYNVQKELQDLRAKVDESELKMKKDKKISKLEEERDWYRKEALRLDSFATSMKKEVKFMKEKLESVEDDRSWLEKQLKTCKKQNKLLKAELEITMNGNKVNPPEEALPTHVEIQYANEVGRTMSPVRPGETSSASGSVLNNSSSSAAIQEKKMRDQLRVLKKQLDQAHHTIKFFRANEVQAASQRSELEEFFLKAVDDSKKEIVRRRQKTSAGSSNNNNAIPNAPPTENAAMERLKNGVKLSQFTATDRRRVVESLVANDQVLSFLYDTLFASEEKQSNTGVRGNNGEGSTSRIPGVPYSLVEEDLNEIGASMKLHKEQANTSSLPLLSPKPQQ